jgi:hypothetical protein
MKRRAVVRNAVVVVLGIVAVGLIAWPVYAHCGVCAGSAKDMTSAMESGKSDLSKAITAAEAATKGRALNAYALLDGKALKYEVYALAGDKLMKAELDSAAKVVGSPKEVKTLEEGHSHTHK